MTQACFIPRALNQHAAHVQPTQEVTKAGTLIVVGENRRHLANQEVSSRLPQGSRSDHEQFFPNPVMEE
jgi:hypothetical protein